MHWFLRILQDNSWTESLSLKIFVPFVAECLFDVLNASFMVSIYKVTLKVRQKLVS